MILILNTLNTYVLKLLSKQAMLEFMFSVISFKKEKLFHRGLIKVTSSFFIFKQFFGTI